MNQAEAFFANFPPNTSYYRAMEEDPNCISIDSGDYHVYGTFADGSQAQVLCGFNNRAVPPQA